MPPRSTPGLSTRIFQMRSLLFWLARNPTYCIQRHVSKLIKHTGTVAQTATHVLNCAFVSSLDCNLNFLSLAQTATVDNVLRRSVLHRSMVDKVDVLKTAPVQL